MDTQLKTYKIEANGAMTPMVSVWMTHDEHQVWLTQQQDTSAVEHMLEGIKPLAEEIHQTVKTIEPIESPARRNAPHTSHASPRPGVYGKGKFRISAERMKEFLDSYEKFGGNAPDVAADLGIKVNSISAYKSVAVYHGLLAGTRRAPNGTGKGIISDTRAQDVATMYQLLKGNTKRVARALGLTEGTARTYVNVAKKRGFIKETA